MQPPDGNSRNKTIQGILLDTAVEENYAACVTTKGLLYSLDW